MERIDVQQPTPKPIPAICESTVRPEAQSSSAPAHSWLTSAMAIWLQDDEAKPAATSEHGQATPIR
ncbi:MAG: hypothetical protein EKK47_19325 [Burkholderiales bacterium]|jgi:hypothetical protein|nr:MAG: hypothetical protein EKK47_19325 [Burkholderiales bacterium]